MLALFVGALQVTSALAASEAKNAHPQYVHLPGGKFRSVLPPDGKSSLAVISPYKLRALPVTNGEFLTFVETHPQWRRDRVASIFADTAYLAHWSSSIPPDDSLVQQPVTNVSWFAAEAYCESEGARLPTWHEWEMAAAADDTRQDARNDPDWREHILGWYSQPGGKELAAVGLTPKNVWGVYDMHGLVWEWVEDFSGMMISADSREQGDPDILKFCGSGALSTQDNENYAVLMRVAMLSSLTAPQSTRNMGFRCARHDNENSQ
jgi:formylglycine-generating enzyme required for sulfatase activity